MKSSASHLPAGQTSGGTMTARRVSLWVAGTILLVTSTVSFLDADEPARRRSGPRD